MNDTRSKELCPWQFYKSYIPLGGIFSKILLGVRLHDTPVEIIGCTCKLHLSWAWSLKIFVLGRSQKKMSPLWAEYRIHSNRRPCPDIRPSPSSSSSLHTKMGETGYFLSKTHGSMMNIPYICNYSVHWWCIWGHILKLSFCTNPMSCSRPVGVYLNEYGSWVFVADGLWYRFSFTADPAPDILKFCLSMSPILREHFCQSKHWLLETGLTVFHYTVLMSLERPVGTMSQQEKNLNQEVWQSRAVGDFSMWVLIIPEVTCIKCLEQWRW